MAPGVDGAQAARAADAVPRHPRQRSPRRWAGAPIPSGCCQFLPPGGRCEILDSRALRPHRAAASWCRELRPRPRRAEPMGRVDVRSTTTASSWPCTASASGDGRPLLFLHGLGERPRRPCRRGSTRGRGRSRRSTSPATASRRSPSAAATRPRSCSPTPTSPSPSSARRRCSVAASGPSSRCMLAGARPADVFGAILADGPGLAGGPTFPTSQSFFVLPRAPGPARSVRARRADPRPAPGGLRRGVRAPRPRRLPARRADHGVGGVPAAVAGGRGRRARRRPHVDPRRPHPLRRTVDWSLARSLAVACRMRAVVLAVVAFAAMEPVTAATHRFVMHGVGMRAAPQPPPPRPIAAGRPTTPTR